MIAGLVFNRVIATLFTRSRYSTQLVIKYDSILSDSFVHYLIRIRLFLSNKWFVDFLLNNYVGLYVLKHSYTTLYKLFEKGVFEIITINWLAYGVANAGRLVSRRHSGSLYSGLCAIIISCIFIGGVICLLK
jgi:hypothetical protein